VRTIDRLAIRDPLYVGVRPLFRARHRARSALMTPGAQFKERERRGRARAAAIVVADIRGCRNIEPEGGDDVDHAPEEASSDRGSMPASISGSWYSLMTGIDRPHAPEGRWQDPAARLHRFAVCDAAPSREERVPRPTAARRRRPGPCRKQNEPPGGAWPARIAGPACAPASSRRPSGSSIDRGVDSVIARSGWVVLRRSRSISGSEARSTTGPAPLHRHRPPLPTELANESCSAPLAQWAARRISWGAPVPSPPNPRKCP
jgi:hypothetical protein